MFTTANSVRLALLVASSLAAGSLVAARTHAGARPRSHVTARQRKPAARLPAFNDYPARDSFDGRPASVRLRTRRDRQFRTRLREGAAEGPNFAGGYTVVYWGCGTGCAEIAVVDAKTGLVYWPPQQYVDIPSGDEGEDDPYGPGYRLDSRLLVLTRSNYDREASYTAYFYVFYGKGFRLVREARLNHAPAEDDPMRNDPVDPKVEFFRIDPKGRVLESCQPQPNRRRAPSPSHTRPTPTTPSCSTASRRGSSTPANSNSSTSSKTSRR